MLADAATRTAKRMLLIPSILQRSCRRRLVTLAALGIALLWAPVLWADAYTVELVVFESKTTTNDETWTPRQLLELEHKGPLRQSTSEPDTAVDFVAVQRLNDVLSILQENPGYRVLSYAAWIQEAVEKSAAPVVPVVPRLSADSPSGEFSGAAKFYKGTFLQIELNLKLQPVITSVTQSGDLADLYRQRLLPEEHVLVERRRVRLNEVHYFDHPRLGAIVTVWRP